MPKAFETPQITEETQWRVVTEPKPIDGVRFSTGEEAQAFIESLRELGDKDYVPTAVIRVDRRLEVEETLIFLPDEKLKPADITPLIRAKLLKLGGEAPVGEAALEWAVRETMEALSELQQ